MDITALLKKGFRLTAISSFFFWHFAFALPQNGEVALGSATISQSQNQTTINQASAKAVINWTSFNTAPNEAVQFNQPNSNAIALNRINSGEVTNFAGILNANGQVWIINPNGILFSSTAKVDVAGLLATTHNISDINFLMGKYKFILDSNYEDSKVINNGSITIKDTGYAALVAPTVINSGVIVANLGKVSLSTGAEYVLDLYGDQLINFGTSAPIPNGSVSNTGLIHATGGKVYMTANSAAKVVNEVVSMSGVIEATTATTGQNGEIILNGGNAGVTHVSGKIHAPKGHVETSGHVLILDSNMVIDAVGGNWLVDPWNITVVAGSGTVNNDGPTTFAPNGSNSQIGANLINTQLGAGTNVTLDTNSGGSDAGNITISSGIVWSTSALLTLTANNNIVINAAINGGANGLVTLNAGGAISQSAGITANTLTTNSGAGTTLTSVFNAVSNFNATNTTSGNISFTNTLPLTVVSLSAQSSGSISISNSGNITFNSAFVVPANTSLTSTSGSIIFNSTVDDSVLKTHSLTLTSPVFPTFFSAPGGITPLGTLNISKPSITVDATLASFVVGQLNLGTNVGLTSSSTAMTISSPISAGSTGSFSAIASAGINLAVSNSTGGSQSYSGPVLLSTSPITLTSTGGSIVFSSTINGAVDLTLSAATGQVYFGSNVGNATPLLSLTVTGGTPFGSFTNPPGSNPGIYVYSSVINTSGNQTYNTALSESATTTFTSTGGDITFGGIFANPIIGLGAVFPIINANTVSFNGGASGGLNFDGTSTLTVNASTGININVAKMFSRFGSQTYNGNMTIQTNTNFQVLNTIGTTNFTFNGNILPATDNGQSFTISTFDNNNNFGGALTMSGELGNSTHRFSSINIALQGSQDTFNGSIVSAGAVNINSSWGSFGGNNSITFSSTSSLVAGGPVTLTSTNTGVNTFVNLSGLLGTAASPLSSLTVIAGNQGITLGSTGQIFTTGATSLNTTGPVTINGQFGSVGNPLGSLAVTGSSITFGATANPEVFVTGTEVYTGPVNITGVSPQLQFDGTSVTFNNAVNSTSATPVVISGNLILTANTGSMGQTNPLGSLAVTGTSSIGGNITTVNNQTYTGPVTLTHADTLTSNSGNILFGNTVNGAFALITSSTSGTTTFANTVGNSLALASLTTSGIVDINGGAVTTTGLQNYQNAVILGADTVLTSTGGGTINFASINSDGTPRGLTLTTSAMMILTGNIGTAVSPSGILKFLTITNAATISTPTINTTQAQTYTGAVTLSAANITLNTNAGGTITFGNTINGASNLTTNATSTGTVIFNNTVGNSTALTSLAVTGVADIKTNSIKTTGAQTYNNAITLDNIAALTMQGSLMIFNGAVDSKTTSTALTITGNLAVAASGSIGLNFASPGNVQVASIFVSGTTLGPNTNTSGNQTYSGAVTLNTDETMISTGGTITFNSTVNGDGVSGRNLIARAMTAGQLVTFIGSVGGLVPLASLTVNDNSAVGGVDIYPNVNITTTGDQTYNGPLTMQAFTVAGTSTLTTTSGGNVLFNGTIGDSNGGAHTLVVNSSGDVTFANAVSGIRGLTVTAANGIKIKTNSIQITGNFGGGCCASSAINFVSPVVLYTDTTISTGWDSIAFGSTIDSDSVLTPRNLVVNSNPVNGFNGLLTIAGNIGATAPLGNVTLALNNAQTVPGLAAIILNGSIINVTGQLFLNMATNFAPARGEIHLNGGASGVYNVGSLVADADTSGSIYFNVPTINSATGQTYSSPSELQRNVTLNNATSGNINFASTLNGDGVSPRSLTTVNSNGSTVFGGIVGGLQPLSFIDVTGGVAINTSAIITSGLQLYRGAGTLGATSTLTSQASTITFNSTLNGGFGLTASVINGQSLTFNGAVGATTALASITTAATGTTNINGGLVKTTGSQTYGNPILLNNPNSPYDTTIQNTTSGVLTFASINASPSAANAQNLTLISPAVLASAISLTGNIGTLNSLLTSLTIGSNTIGTFVNIATATINTVSAQTYWGPVTLVSSPNLTLTTPGNITFKSTVNGDVAGTRALTVTAGIFNGNVGSNFALSALTTNFGAQFNGVTVTTTGAQTYNNIATIVSGANTFNSTAGGTISLNGLTDTVTGGSAIFSTSGTFSDNGSLLLNNAGLTSETLTVTAGAINIGVSSGTFITNTGGTQTYNGPTTSNAGVQTFTSTGGDITFNGTWSATGGGITVTANNLNLNGNVGGNTANNFSTAFGGLNVNGNVSFGSATTVCNCGGFSGSGGGFTVTGNVTINGTNLALAARSFSFGGTITSLVNNTALTFTNNDFNGQTVFGGNINLPGVSSSITVTDIASGGGTIFNSPVTTVDVATQIYNPAVFSINTGTGTTLTLKNTGGTANVTINGNNSIGNSSAGLNVQGNLTLGGTQGVALARLTVTGNTLLGGTTSFTTSVGDINFGGTINNAFALTLNSGANNVIFNGVVGGVTPLASLAVTGATDIKTSLIKTTGAQTYNNSVLLDNIAALTTQGSLMTFNSTVNSKTTSTALTITGNLAVGPSGSIGLQFASPGNVHVGSILVTGTTLGPNITTAGNQTYIGALALNTNETMISTAGSISYNSTVDNCTGLACTSGSGPFNLVANAATTVTFAGAVGNISPLGSLTVTGTTGININGGFVTTANNQTYNNLVTMGNSLVITAGTSGCSTTNCVQFTLGTAGLAGITGPTRNLFIYTYDASKGASGNGIAGTVNVSGFLMGGTGGGNISPLVADYSTVGGSSGVGAWNNTQIDPAATGTYCVNGNCISGSRVLNIFATNDSKIYGQVFTPTLFSTSGLAPGDSVTGLTLTSAGSGPTASVLGGPYSIVPSNASGPGIFNHYSGINYFVGSLTVNPAPLNLTSTSQSKTYGQPLSATTPFFTPSGLQNGETVGTVDIVSAGLSPTAGVAGSPYAITGVSNAAGGTFTPSNYAITYTPAGSITVNPAPLTLTSDSQVKMYGTALLSSTPFFTPSGLQNGETVGTVDIVSAGLSPTAGVAGSPYAITGVSNAAGGTFTPNNYAITYVPAGTITVNPAPLNITPDTQTKNYGMSLPTSTTFFTPTGLQNGETVGTVDIVSAGLSPTAGVAGSPYAITGVSNATGGTFDPNNYTITYTPANNIIVNPAPLNITSDPQTKVYGTALSPTTTFFTPTGLQNGETIGTVDIVSAGLSPTASVSGGPYPITGVSNATGGTFNPTNYAITYTPANAVTITPASLTITPYSQTKTFGTTLSPTTTLFAVTPLLNGETITTIDIVSVGLPGAAPVGVYPITNVTNLVGAGGFDPNNYSIGLNLAGANIIVNAAPSNPQNIPPKQEFNPISGPCSAGNCGPLEIILAKNNCAYSNVDLMDEQYRLNNKVIIKQEEMCACHPDNVWVKYCKANIQTVVKNSYHANSAPAPVSAKQQLLTAPKHWWNEMFNYDGKLIR